MLMKSHLGRKRSRIEILADKQAKADEEERAARNEQRIAELEQQLGLQD